MEQTPYRQPVPVELGPLVREHRWGLTTFLVVLGLFFLAPGFLVPFAFREDMSTWNPMTWIGLALGGVGLPAMGIYALVSARRLTQNYVRIHDGGFAYKWTAKEAVVGWDDVRSIKSKIEQKHTNGIPGPVTHSHKIKTHGGLELSITHGYRDVEKLVAEIRRRARPHLEKRAREEFAAGKELSFGEIRLHAQRGITTSNGTLPWKDVHALTVSAGEVTILREARPTPRSWSKEDVADVENLDVLLSLVNARTEQRD